jgi:LysR substrate binding domain
VELWRPVRDRFEPLRKGEIELMATRLPLKQPDITVGPVLSQEPRVLAVARDHPLADRTAVSIEDIADHSVISADDLFPKELAEAFIPRTTPSGRPIRRLRTPINDLNELIIQIARGKIVHPAVPSFASYFGHPNVAYLPIVDMPPSRSALVWRRRDLDPRLRGFIRVARDALRAAPNQRRRARA